jgi:hypothetical protein
MQILIPGKLKLTVPVVLLGDDYSDHEKNLKPELIG